jgi:hypothetical protein
MRSSSGRRLRVREGVELLLAPEDSTDGISVYVEDCDFAEDEDEITIDIEETGEGWAYGEYSQYRMQPPKVCAHSSSTSDGVLD